MEEALVAYLLTALSAVAGSRVHWLRRPQASALPAVTLQTASARPEYHLEGRDGEQGDLIQIDAWAASFTSLKALERALTAALDGPLPAPLLFAEIESRRETTEEQPGPDGTGSTTFYRASLDVRLWHAAAV